MGNLPFFAEIWIPFRSQTPWRIIGKPLKAQIVAQFNSEYSLCKCMPVIRSYKLTLPALCWAWSRTASQNLCKIIIIIRAKQHSTKQPTEAYCNSRTRLFPSVIIYGAEVGRGVQPLEPDVCCAHQDTPQTYKSGLQQELYPILSRENELKLEIQQTPILLPANLERI